MSTILLQNNWEIAEAFVNLTTSTQYHKANSIDQQNLLFQFTDQISIKSDGNTTILYSGKIDSQSSNGLVEKMINDKQDIRAINKTLAAEFLNSREFQTAYAKTAGLTLEQYNNNSIEKATQLQDKLFHGETGTWARVSQRFVAETKGHVKILTSPAANPKGVFALTELPELKKNTQVKSVNGHTKAQFNKMNLQEILQDAYPKRYSIQELSSPTKIDKKVAFKTAY